MPRPLWRNILGRLVPASDDGRIAAALERLDAMQARLDRLEARFAEQAEWSAEVRAELLALANSLGVYRQDVERLLADSADRSEQK